MQSILEAKDNHRWISEQDIVGYLEFSLGSLYKGSRVQWSRETSLVELDLTSQFMSDFDLWCQNNKDVANLNKAPNGMVQFQLGKGNPRSKIPKISQSHPIMRFLAQEIQMSGRTQHEPIGARLDSSKIKIKLQPGIYLGTVQSWKFGSGADTEKLGQCFFNIHDDSKLDQKSSEKLVNAVIENGSHWETAHEIFSEECLSETILPNLENYLEDEFYKEIENRKVKMEDRVSIQLATLEKRAEDERRKLNRIILNSPASVKAANEGRLRKLNERIELREQKIRQQISSQSESSDVALILLEVV